MKILGIDPSMRSTGICLRTTGGDPIVYNLICSAPTKKARAFKHPRFELFTYEPESVASKDAIAKESAKTANVAAVVGVIERLIGKYKPDTAFIEAISYGSAGRIDELAGLNYGIRLALYNRHIPVYAVAPTANKLNFMGHGQATKDMMLAGWEACEPDYALFESALGKGTEDLADAFALTTMPIL